MFNLFGKKRKNIPSIKDLAVTEEGKKLSSPISLNIKGVLREAMEKLAYALEQNQEKDKTIMCFVASENKNYSGKVGEREIETMDISFVRGSSRTLTEVLMNMGNRDPEHFGKIIITVAELLQSKHPELKKLKQEIDSSLPELEKLAEKLANMPESMRKAALDVEINGRKGKAFNIDKLANASEEEIDKIIDSMLNDDDDED